MQSLEIDQPTFIMNLEFMCCFFVLALSVLSVRGQVAPEKEVNLTQVNPSDRVDANIYVSNQNSLSFQEVNAPFSPFPRWFDVILQSILSSMKASGIFSHDYNSSMKAEGMDVESEPAQPNVLKKLVNTLKQGVKVISKTVKDLFEPDEDARYNPHPPPPPAKANGVFTP